MRCSKTSISSGIVGGSACGMNSAGNTGTLNSNTNALVPSTGTQLKKTKIPLGDANENEETGNIITATEDAIIASSDCELNDAGKSRRQGGSSGTSGGSGGNGTSSTMKSGIIPGNLVLQHATKSIDPSIQGHVVLERNAINTGIVGGPGTTGTLRSTGGMRTPSAGHTSPTSSVSSTHLIFGQGHKQQQLAAGSMNGVQPTQEAFYHTPDYYAWQKANKGQSRDYHGTGVSPSSQQQQQQHEFFYWTQKHQQGHGKKKRGSATGSDSPSGSLHSRNTATSQQILFYPSYKKTSLKQQQQPPLIQPQHPYYAEALDPGAPPPHYQQQQQHRRPHQYQQQQYQQQQLQQQQLSSDDEQMEHAAHAHLLQQMNRRGPGPGEFAISQPGTQQRYYRNKHSNCDLNQPDKFDLTRGGNGGETYYNQGSLASDNGPVYEEILSNRTSDVQHYNVDDLIPHDYEDERVMQAAYQRQQQQQQQRKLNRYPQNGVGGIAASTAAATPIAGVAATRSHPHGYVDDFEGHEAESPYTDDEDEDDDEEPDDECSDDHLPPQSDERMRRLMAMQDADFQRRFQ